MSTKVKKICVSIPGDIVADLDAIASYLNISRSAVMSLMLSKSVGPFKTLSRQVSLIDETDNLKRDRLVESAVRDMTKKLSQLKRGNYDQIQ